jgi:acetyl/propionyl-CoA carboxylase alpha subunit
LRTPGGPGIRDDGGADVGTDVPVFYDALVSKLVAHGESRGDATARMRRALREYAVAGIRTSLPFFRWILARPEFVEGRFHTEFLDDVLQRRAGEPFDEPDTSLEEVACVAACLVELTQPASSPAVSGWATAGRLAGLRE